MEIRSGDKANIHGCVLCTVGAQWGRGPGVRREKSGLMEIRSGDKANIHGCVLCPLGANVAQRTISCRSATGSADSRRGRRSSRAVDSKWSFGTQAAVVIATPVKVPSAEAFARNLLLVMLVGSTRFL